jgi:antitoxin CptB
VSNYQYLRWKCRRGILELDLWLNDVLKRHYQSLSQSEKALFDVMLDQPDPLLLDWYLQRARPDDPLMCRLLKKITDIPES